MIITEHCQCQNLLASYSLGQWLRLWVTCRLGLRSGLRRLFSGRKKNLSRVGESSRFPPGSWVRVIDRHRVEATLDSRKSLRGLQFVDQQWPYCGTTHRVLKSVRRLLDDRGRMRRVERTVLLEGATCGGPDGASGCGRECPLMFRDEWLEEAAEPGPTESTCHPSTFFATVRSVAEIEQTLDRHGKHRGLMFMPEMYTYAGRRFPVIGKVERIWEGNRQNVAKDPVYILEGLYCSGAVLGAQGPCDRGCRLLWQEAWLRLEPAVSQNSSTD